MRLTLLKPLLAGFFLITMHSAFAGGTTREEPQSTINFIKPYRIVYEVKFDTFLPFEGKAIRQLKLQKDGGWKLSHSIDSGVINVRESSRFDWQNKQPKTRQYHYKQNSIGKDKDEQLKFDWVNLQAHHNTDKPPGSFAIPDNTLDKLTYQLKIRQDLAIGKEPGVYTVADKRRLKEYGFILLGEEPLDTPVGTLNTLKIKRDRGPDSKRETTLWLAKDWDYLLVKLQQQEKGKDYEVVIEKGVWDGKAIKGL